MFLTLEFVAEHKGDPSYERSALFCPEWELIEFNRRKVRSVDPYVERRAMGSAMNLLLNARVLEVTLSYLPQFSFDLRA